MTLATGNDSVLYNMHELSSNFGLVRESTLQARLKSISVPPLQDGYILVQTKALALNPTDWTTLEAPGADWTLVGCDYAGIVLAIGCSVTKNFKIGDRVTGLAHGANDLKPFTGAFARIIAVKGDLQIKIPDHVSWEEACTVGVGTATAARALWTELGLRSPRVAHESSIINGEDASEWVLVYGGSTATGTVAIQFAKL